MLKGRSGWQELLTVGAGSNFAREAGWKWEKPKDVVRRLPVGKS